MQPGVKVSALAIVFLVSACGSGLRPTASPPPAASATSVATATPGASATGFPTASAGARCGDSRGDSPDPTYVFQKVSIPLGSDACWNIGPLADPQILDLTNDGSLVAFDARDADHEADLWYGDLQKGTVAVVYQASAAEGTRVGIWSPQLAGDHLLWVEDVYDWSSDQHPVTAWSLKDMNLTTHRVSVVAHDRMPNYGGQMYLDSIKFDGQRIALLEALASGKWQIEIRDILGNLQDTIRFTGDPYDFALVPDGVLYTTGKGDPNSGAIGQMHLWHWTPLSGSQEIGKEVYEVNAEGPLAAWVADPQASSQTSGWFADQSVCGCRSLCQDSGHQP